MLTFRNTNFIFLLLLTTLVILQINFIHIDLGFYLLLFFIYGIAVFYGCAFIQSGFFVSAICASKTTDKVIAISFDDGPTSEFTPKVLKILNEYSVEAAFFCIGNKIKGNEEIIRQIVNENHIIGNHSFSHHFWFDLFSTEKMTADIKSMSNEVNAAIGLTPVLFRPPYGVTNPELARAILEGNYITVGWSVRSMDTKIKSEEKLFKKITTKIHPGAIYLFHDTNKTTLAVLPAFLKFVKENNYTIVRLDKMLHLKPYE